ncbi:MAG: DUF4381 domain-containing protein [Pseudomonadales bacterium]
MQPDLLQQLRDIHLPAEPLWWPPAPGWWLLGLLALAGIAYLGVLAHRALQRRRPIRAARRYYASLYAAYQRGELDDRDYLDGANELLKRLYVHGLQEDAARRANDVDWLAFLDARSGGTSFREGVGRQLGNQRFSRHPEIDPEALHPLIERLFRAARL